MRQRGGLRVTIDEPPFAIRSAENSAADLSPQSPQTPPSSSATSRFANAPPVAILRTHGDDGSRSPQRPGGPGGGGGGGGGSSPGAALHSHFSPATVSSGPPAAGVAVGGGPTSRLPPPVAFGHYNISVLAPEDDDDVIVFSPVFFSAPNVFSHSEVSDTMVSSSPEKGATSQRQDDATLSASAAPFSATDELNESRRRSSVAAAAVAATALATRSVSYFALPLHRRPMIAPHVAPYFFNAKPRYRTLLSGFVDLVKCNAPKALPDVERSSNAVLEAVSTRAAVGGGPGDDDDNDDELVPIMFAPLWVQTLLAVLVAGSAVLVFAFPSVLHVDMFWSKNSLEAVDALLPLVLFALAVFSRTVAQSRGVDLGATDRHHRIHPLHEEALSSYFVDLDRHKVQRMASSRKKGLLVRRKTLSKISMHLQRETAADGGGHAGDDAALPPVASPHRRAAAAGGGGGGVVRFSTVAANQVHHSHRQQGADADAEGGGGSPLGVGGHSVIRASLYAEMIVSNASLSAAAETRSVPLGVTLGVPLVIALSPAAGRVLAGGAIWGQGSLPELALLIFGGFLSTAAAHTVTVMINLHHETLRYHDICVARVTNALPGTGSQDDDPFAKFFPQIPLNCVGNVMAWHRLRWALGHAPHPLIATGTVVFEAVAVLSTIFILFSIISDFTVGDARFTGAGSGVATALVFVVPAMTSTLLRTPLRINQQQLHHVAALGHIIVESLGTDARKAQRAARKQPSSNPLEQAPRRESGFAHSTSSDSLTAGVGGNGGGERDAEFDAHVNLRRVMRDIAAAMPHHTICHRFLGMTVTPVVVLGFLAVFAGLAVISVQLIVRLFTAPSS